MWTQADVDALKAVIATGVLTVTYSGPPARTVTYQSTSEMRKALSEMMREVAAEAGTTSTVRYAKTSKGF